MFKIPSHNNSTNERRELRANNKAAARANRQVGNQAAIERIQKQAAMILAGGAVVEVEGGFHVETSPFSYHFVARRESGEVSCFCIDDFKHGSCAHRLVAEGYLRRLAADAEAANKPFLATLEYGNRKGLDFVKEQTFTTEAEAVEWLKTEAANKFMPTGRVTDRFGFACFEIADAYFERYQEAA